jgi:transitional endoplasmic reticulum ATPase
MDEATLKVKEARVNEVGRGIARLDPEIFSEMELSPGDILLLEGKRKAAAIVLQGPVTDAGKKVIRLDGILRHIAGVGVDDEVRVSRSDSGEAREVHLAPPQAIEFSEDFPAYIQERIINMPLMQGNSLVIDVLGTSLPLAVVGVKPDGIVRVTSDTRLIISKKPVKIIPK